MILRFKRRNIQTGDLEKAWLSIGQCIESKGVESLCTENNWLEFHTKHLFAYWSFELFSLVDYGTLELVKEKDTVVYKVVSYRIWLFLGLMFVVPWFLTKDLLFIGFAGVFTAILLGFIWLSHYLFFRKIVRLFSKP